MCVHGSRYKIFCDEKYSSRLLYNYLYEFVTAKHLGLKLSISNLYLLLQATFPSLDIHIEEEI